VINLEQPDIVFLSEAMRDAMWCGVDQVRFLAEATGMHAFAFGENYNVGLPFLRVRSGNAILSRFPIESVANEDLAGRRPFYITKNNRRVLWCAAEIGGRRVLLGAIHTDSFNPRNNLKQTKQILDYLGDRPAIIAGDFNANPGEPSIELIRGSGRFSGTVDGPLTFPADKPAQRLDFIFAPHDWELIEARVIDSQASDHKPVVSVFRVK
jgi:endonuclease/exonuclease/phosphatase family metal-dependent hydrolase